jgi:glutamine synthetase
MSAPAQPHPFLATDPAAPLAERVRAAGIREVECVFPDISGVPRGKFMPAESFARGAELRIAQAIPMQCVTGEYSLDTTLFADSDPDVRLVPDAATLRPVPWASPQRPRLLALHDCLEPDGSPCDYAVRNLLKGVLARYAALGLTPVVAPEIEFYLFAAHSDPAHPPEPPRGLRSGRAEAGDAAFSLHMRNDLAPFWDEFQAALETLGVATDTWIHEVGCSQYEINLLHGDALAVADQAFLFKLAAREVALRHGLNAVFMAKPVAGQAGSSMHIHQSLVDEHGRNIFSRPDGSADPRFFHFIGGLQAHGADLALCFAPNVNAFRRYVAGAQAPVNLHWGEDNRSTGLRVPRSGPAARRVENRIAGADANPYVAIAASLAAGLAGVEDQLQPGAPVGTTDNASTVAGSQTLPPTLAHALERFEAALPGTVSRLLGERFARGYLAVKTLEHEHYQREISAWERRYLLPQV